MSDFAKQSALRQYGEVAIQAAVSYSNPHHLIQLLLEGALDRIAVAKGHMQRGEMAQKGVYIGKAIEIIGGLRGCLNREAGGDIARNLYDLYDYMERRLLEATAQNASALLDEVHGLLSEIKDAWCAIADTPEVAGPRDSAMHSASAPVVG